MIKIPKYNKPVILNYKIKLLSGLHIWWSKETLKIGWIDSPVVKHPITNEPYIPWSSIKWKMRALIEMTEWEYTKKTNKDGKIEYWPSANLANNIAKSFGCAGDIKIASRILVEDFVLTDKWKKIFEELRTDFYEDKAENSVPRFLSGNANPRHIERVPANVEFEWKIVLTAVEDWNYPIKEEELRTILNNWIKLIESFWIGWWVSRWNGRIKFKEN